MDVLTDIRAGCPCSNLDYCPAAEFIRHMPERTIVQHKCVEVYKWFLGQQLNRDVSWAEAYQSWTEDGLAKKFADIWQPGMPHDAALDLMRMHHHG